MARQGTNVTRISGDVFVKEGATKERVDEFVNVKRMAEIWARANSYASLSDNPNPESGRQASGATLFPDSKIQVRVDGGFIDGIDIESGLANIWLAPGKLALTPVAELSGMVWVHVAADGRTVVAGGRETIHNRKTRRAVTIDENQQVLITEDDIGQPEPMDQRFFQGPRDSL
ncbi:MAG: hypothetical protein QMD53_06685 [Actinomycetota bacterium]|nr:hypothetical protein [Actinomycetota bacterium]